MFNDNFYKQACGIEMGSNYLNSAAKLFLFDFEFKYTIKENKRYKIFHYIDDILVCNADLLYF